MNLQNDGLNAVRALRTHPAWPDFLKAILEQSRQSMNRALEAEPAVQQKASGYALAVRDFWIALEAATTNVAPNQVKKPAPKE